MAKEAKKSTPKSSSASKTPEIKTTGMEYSSQGSGYGHSTATISNKNATIEVDAQYTLATNKKNQTEIRATITSTESKGKKTTEDETQMTGTIDPNSGSVRFTQQQTITTTEQLANGGKRVQGYSNDQSSSLVDTMSVAKGLRLAGDTNKYDHIGGTYDATFDASEKMKKYEGHYKSPAGGYRSDEITSYDNKEQIKEAMRAQYYEASASFSHQKGTMENAGDIDFYATMERDGSVHYQTGQNKSGNTILNTVVEVDAGGKASGYTVEQRRDVATNMWTEADTAKRKVLTAKEAEKLRKKMQKRGDKVAQKVSGQKMADYQQGKQSYKSVGGREYFNKQPPETEKAYQEAKKVNQDIAKTADNAFRQLTPEEASALLVQQKINEIKSK